MRSLAKIGTSHGPEFAEAMDENFAELKQRIEALGGPPLVLIFRREKGIPLTLAEVDHNFLVLEQRVGELERGR